MVQGAVPDGVDDGGHAPAMGCLHQGVHPVPGVHGDPQPGLRGVGVGGGQQGGAGSQGAVQNNFKGSDGEVPLLPAGVEALVKKGL